MFAKLQNLKQNIIDKALPNTAEKLQQQRSRRKKSQADLNGDAASSVNHGAQVARQPKVVGRNLNTGVDYGLGKLQYMIRYDVKSASLKLFIYRGIRVAGKDPRGTSDCFIRIDFVPAARRCHFETSIQMKNLNPIWNEIFVFRNFPNRDLKKMRLRLTVIDWDPDGKFDPIGVSEYELRKIHQTLKRANEMNVKICERPPESHDIDMNNAGETVPPPPSYQSQLQPLNPAEIESALQTVSNNSTKNRFLKKIAIPENFTNKIMSVKKLATAVRTMKSPVGGKDVSAGSVGSVGTKKSVPCVEEPDMEVNAANRGGTVTSRDEIIASHNNNNNNINNNNEINDAVITIDNERLEDEKDRRRHQPSRIVETEADFLEKRDDVVEENVVFAAPIAAVEYAETEFSIEPPGRMPDGADTGADYHGLTRQELDAWLDWLVTQPDPVRNWAQQEEDEEAEAAAAAAQQKAEGNLSVCDADDEDEEESEIDDSVSIRAFKAELERIKRAQNAGSNYSSSRLQQKVMGASHAPPDHPSPAKPNEEALEKTSIPIDEESESEEELDISERPNIIRKIFIERYLSPILNSRPSYGQIRISLAFMTSFNCVLIRIIEGKDMRDPTGRRFVIYCRVKQLHVSLAREKLRAVNQTSYRFNTMRPIWNEQFAYSVALNKVAKMALEVEVFHSPHFDARVRRKKTSVGVDKLLGRIRFGLKSFPKPKQHFIAMIQSPNQPIANWYSVRV